MAVIENAGTSPEALAEWRASMRSMGYAELMAQQLVQRGAEHALAELQKHGPTPENCAAMLASIREGLIEVHAVAAERGIPLAGYDAPAAGEQAGHSEGTINGVPREQFEFHFRRLHELMCQANIIRNPAGFSFNGWTADGRAVRHKFKLDGYERTGSGVEKERIARAAIKAKGGA